MKSEQYLLIEHFDIAWDDTSETFSDVLAEIGTKFPEVFIRIRAIEGPAGGWPTIDIMIPDSKLETFLENLGFDESDFDIWREDAKAV